MLVSLEEWMQVSTWLHTPKSFLCLLTDLSRPNEILCTSTPPSLEKESPPECLRLIVGEAVERKDIVNPWGNCRLAYVNQQNKAGK